MKAERVPIILLVEDQAIIAMAEKRFLEQGGFQVHWVGSGAEGLAAATGTVDLVLMDIDLGSGPNGFETAAAILKERDLPIIFLSAHSSEEDAAAALCLSPYGLLPKHLAPQLIVSAVRLALDQHEARHCLAEKDAALAELRARVTATLGILGTLLDLEEASLGPSGVRISLKDARSRHLTLSLLFDRLFQGADEHEVSVRGYINDLVAQVGPGGTEGDGVEIQCYIEDFRLGVRRLFLLGIIVEELLSRALGRLDGGTGSGSITLSIFQDDKDCIEVLVSDDGKAVDASAPGPGLELVHALVRQVNAVIERREGGGNTFRVRIPPEQAWS